MGKATRTSWKPGTTGNPRGAPKKPRRFTAALERVLSRSVILANGTKVSGKDYVASIIAQAVEKGSVELANGTIMDLPPQEVLKLVQWAYSHVDGPPKAEMGIDLQGNLNVRLDWGDNADDDNNNA